MITPNQHLLRIRDALSSDGHSIWFVGGCVRDSILGEEPKDIDLCTDATPDEAMACYRAHGLRYFKTGLAHGTLTVRAGGESYEITSLRTESDHDGRHAVVSYTRDLRDDLSRRDLTINAIAQSFDGDIIDPFGGMSDLRNERVRMVGDPVERFKEDYLRILRFFRFHARFAGVRPFDEAALKAVWETKEGLNDISGERKWLEMQKIVVGPFAALTLQRMQKNGVTQAIGIKWLDAISAVQAQLQGVDSPATVLGLILDKQIIDKVMSDWRLSNNERAEARFAQLHRHTDSIERFKELLVDGARPEWVELMLKWRGLESLSEWDVPVFPVNGGDIQKAGVEQGPSVGNYMRHLKKLWKESNYTHSKDYLIAQIG